MNVKLIAHTQVSSEFLSSLTNKMNNFFFSDGQAVALTAIRTCYSHNESSEIIELEGEKYFGSEASDGEGGSDADRLIRHIMKSGHTSTIEHLTYTFTIEGVSRSLLAQITRHRFMSFSVQSQRYVKFGSEDKSGGFDAVIPESWKKNLSEEMIDYILETSQIQYDELRKRGVPAEDARFILPNAATCNMVMTTNLRSLLDFYKKRTSPQAQWEIRELANKLKEEVIKVEPWTESFFGGDK